MMNMDPLFAGRLIRTYSGHYFDVFDPNPDHLEIIDIAHTRPILLPWSRQRKICPFSVKVIKEKPQQSI